MTEDLDALMREIHACPRGITCRPGRGVLYPIPPQGPHTERGPDVLLVGWNPRKSECHHLSLPPLPTWRAEAEGALVEVQKHDPVEARNVRSVLPESHSLDSGRVMRTFLWKWPTRFKTAGGESGEYASRCIRMHFESELAALRPRVVLTFHAEAAAHFEERARALGVDVREPHAVVRRSEALGWAPPSRAFGWDMGLVLLKDASEPYDSRTISWARQAVDYVLANTPAK